MPSPFFSSFRLPLKPRFERVAMSDYRKRAEMPAEADVMEKKSSFWAPDTVTPRVAVLGFFLFAGWAYRKNREVEHREAETQAACEKEVVEHPESCRMDCWARTGKQPPCYCYADVPSRDVPYRCTGGMK